MARKRYRLLGVRGPVVRCFRCFAEAKWRKRPWPNDTDRSLPYGWRIVEDDDGSFFPVCRKCLASSD